MWSVLYRAHAIAILLFATTVGAQEPPKDQPPLWSAKPDIPAFEKMENARLAAAQQAIDQIVAVKGSRTVENTLVPYDEAMRRLNAAMYFAILMQQVHPDVAFRDRATAMTTKVSSAMTALSLNREVYHALANLEDHHFKFPQHRVPGDIHVHFFGTSKLSFQQRDWEYRTGDIVEVSFEGLGAPLRNPVVRQAPSETPVRVEAG